MRIDYEVYIINKINFWFPDVLKNVLGKTQLFLVGYIVKNAVIQAYYKLPE